MMGQKPDGQKRLFYSFNLDDHVPSDHSLRGVDRFLDLGQLHQHVLSTAALGGLRLIRSC